MTKPYRSLHRRSREWSRKLRKATEHRRARHALHALLTPSQLAGLLLPEYDPFSPTTPPTSR